ncbi:MAG: FliM/FliN family flagellar motor switch protein [Pseudomonadota bacterium]
MSSKERPNGSETDWDLPDGADEGRMFPTSKGVLTADEIEALLRPDLSDMALSPAEPETVAAYPQDAFEDTQPDHDLECVLAQKENARALAARMALAFREGAGFRAAIHLDEVARVGRADLLNALVNASTALACFGPDAQTISHVLVLPGELCDALIATACGAGLSTGRLGDGWTLSAIDCALLSQLLQPIADAVGQDTGLQMLETDAAFVTSLLPQPMTYVADFTAEAGPLRTPFAVVAAVEVEQLSEPLEQKSLGKAAPVTAVLTARMARLSVPLSRLTSLKAGSTLLLGLPADQPVEILSGGRDGPVAFEGEIGRRGQKMAVRVTGKRRAVLDV